MTTKSYTPRAISALGSSAVLWLAINVAADAVAIVSAGTEVVMLSSMPGQTGLDEWGGFPDPSGMSMWTGLARIPIFLAFLITTVIVLKWMYRANRNAHAFGRGLVSTPPGAVYWYFVPIANLWKPFQAMNETWRVSHDPEGWKRTFVPDLMRWWWGFWLIGTILGNASGRIGWRADDTGALQLATTLEILSSVMMIGAGLSLIGIVRSVSSRQTSLIEQGWSRPERPPPQAWSGVGADEPF